VKTFFRHVKGLLKDSHNNTVSSKRVVVLLSVLMMIIGFVGNMFYGLQVAEHIYNAIMYVVVTGLGMTGLEKFAKPPAGPTDPSD
jgi:hypothetical protein